MESNTIKQSINIRYATGKDMDDVLNMIQELADFEKMASGPLLKSEDLLRDGGFLESDRPQQPLFFCFIAEILNETEVKINIDETRPVKDPATIGFALCFYTYSTWNGKTIFMEDLYVKPEYRELGIGRLLVKSVARHANDNKCTRFDFHVLNWNPACQFYNGLGAVNLTSAEGWQFYRFDKNGIDRILEQ